MIPERSLLRFFLKKASMLMERKSILLPIEKKVIAALGLSTGELDIRIHLSDKLTKTILKLLPKMEIGIFIQSARMEYGLVLKEALLRLQKVSVIMKMTMTMIDLQRLIVKRQKRRKEVARRLPAIRVAVLTIAVTAIALAPAAYVRDCGICFAIFLSPNNPSLERTRRFARY